MLSDFNDSDKMLEKVRFHAAAAAAAAHWTMLTAAD
jgi:hypothetical protein